MAWRGNGYVLTHRKVRKAQRAILALVRYGVISMQRGAINAPVMAARRRVTHVLSSVNKYSVISCRRNVCDEIRKYNPAGASARATASAYESIKAF